MIFQQMHIILKVNPHPCLMVYKTLHDQRIPSFHFIPTMSLFLIRYIHTKFFDVLHKFKIHFLIKSFMLAVDCQIYYQYDHFQPER